MVIITRLIDGSNSARIESQVNSWNLISVLSRIFAPEDIWCQRKCTGKKRHQRRSADFSIAAFVGSGRKDLADNSHCPEDSRDRTNYGQMGKI
ncbi:hypothetical protein TNCV_1500721 [Trichonephila clavipes]|nr:hypothetical protein TNCV_1500721 [Trichonephila clavipes]